MYLVPYKFAVWQCRDMEIERTGFASEKLFDACKFPAVGVYVDREEFLMAFLQKISIFGLKS